MDDASQSHVVIARDIMQRVVISLRPTMSIIEARDLLVKNHISGAPVLGDDGELLGVFSQSDFLRIVFATEVGDGLEEAVLFSGEINSADERWRTIFERLRKLSVGSVQSHTVYTASPTERVSLLARKMKQHRIHRLIVTEHGKVVGVVSAFDLLGVLEASA